MHAPRFHISTFILLVVILAQALTMLAQSRIAARRESAVKAQLSESAEVIEKLSLQKEKYREEIVRIQKNCRDQNQKITTEFATYKESHP